MTNSILHDELRVLNLLNEGFGFIKTIILTIIKEEDVST